MLSCSDYSLGVACSLWSCTCPSSRLCTVRRCSVTPTRVPAPDIQDCFQYECRSPCSESGLVEMSATGSVPKHSVRVLLGWLCGTCPETPIHDLQQVLRVRGSNPGKPWVSGWTVCGRDSSVRWQWWRRRRCQGNSETLPECHVIQHDPVCTWRSGHETLGSGPLQAWSLAPYFTVPVTERGWGQDCPVTTLPGIHMCAACVSLRSNIVSGMLLLTHLDPNLVCTCRPPRRASW